MITFFFKPTLVWMKNLFSAKHILPRRRTPRIKRTNNSGGGKKKRWRLCSKSNIINIERKPTWSIVLLGRRNRRKPARAARRCSLSKRILAIFLFARRRLRNIINIFYTQPNAVSYINNLKEEKSAVAAPRRFSDNNDRVPFYVFIYFRFSLFLFFFFFNKAGKTKAARESTAINQNILVLPPVFTENKAKWMLSASLSFRTTTVSKVHSQKQYRDASVFVLHSFLLPLAFSPTSLPSTPG